VPSIPLTTYRELNPPRFATRRRLLGALATLLLLLIALVDVSILEPRIHVRWRDDVADTQRLDLERRYSLGRGERLQGTTWRYELDDRSPGNVGALIEDAHVVDTAYIDRPTLTVPSREVDISLARAGRLIGPAPEGLIQIQSVLLLVAGGVLVWAAGIDHRRRRRMVGVGIIALVGFGAYALPLEQGIRMGDADTYTASRTSFENYSGVKEIRFEGHLSHAILGRLYIALGRTDEAPARAWRLLMRAATAWFLGMLLLVGVVESWSPTALRYLGLAVIAPPALMYFGYRELGHLSLNLATFPLFMRGVVAGSRHLEASGALAGLAAALHGFGLLSMMGVALAAMAARLRLAQRARVVLTFVAWSVAAYLGWIAIYLIVLKLPVTAGHAESIPLRPWFTDEITDRVNAAVFSGRGARDVLVTALLVGMPLIAVVASLLRRFAVEARVALLYAVPSTVFAIMLWPIQGLAVEMDLVFATFPALYALAWVCAHDRRGTAIAAVILACGHVVLWRIALDSAFVNPRI
jgi:hypothetical protein